MDTGVSSMINIFLSLQPQFQPEKTLRFICPGDTRLSQLKAERFVKTVDGYNLNVLTLKEGLACS